MNSKGCFSAYANNLLAYVEGNLNITPDVGIILPTYCEALNIKKLINEILCQNLNASILVIDDSSSDGTADIVRKLQKEHKCILLYERPKKLGLGTAIVDGFKIFLALRKPPKHIITMDADFSHNPKELARLIENVREGYDLVVGSRYCKGGVTQNWSFIRLVISKMANFFARIRINAKISDCTSGMRCYSLDLVKSIIGCLHSQTYEIQIETIRQAILGNFRIKEVPITFVDRKKGKSKLTINEIIDFLSYIIFMT